MAKNILGRIRFSWSVAAMICFVVSTAFLVLELEISLRPLSLTINAGGLLLLGVLIWLADILCHRFWNLSPALPPDFFKLSAILGLLLLGLSIGWYTNSEGHNEFAARQYLRIISNACALAVVLWYGLRSGNFLRWMLGILCLPVILLPALYLVDNHLRLVNRDYFFRGFTENSSYFALLLLPAIVYFFTLVSDTARSRQSRFLAFLFLVAATMLCLAASSRIVWVSAFIGCAFIVIRQATSQPGRVKFIVQRLAIFFLAFLVAFAVLPVKSKLVVLGRFNTIVYSKLYALREVSAKDASFAKGWSPDLSLDDFVFYPKVFFSAENRLHIWRMSARSFWEHPLGYGPAYNEILALSDGGFDTKTTHNIFLETALSGGVLSLVALCSLAVLIIRAISRSRGKNALTLGLTGTLLAVSLSFIGEDGLYLRWAWILSGLFLAEMWATEKTSNMPEPIHK